MDFSLEVVKYERRGGVEEEINQKMGHKIMLIIGETKTARDE